MTASDADTPISVDTVLQPNDNFVLREEGGEGGILYDPDTGAVRLMNATATAVWKLLDGRRSMGQVIQDLRAQYEDMDAEAEQDVMDLARRLRKAGAATVKG
jgi:hypothetical protein